MRKSLLLPLIFGLAGVAVLLALGKWQVDRLAWKEGVLANIAARIAADPVAVPVAPDPVVDAYLPVIVEGVFAAPALRVLVSRKRVGAGYRLISALQTDGRRILVDRGFVPVGAVIPAPPEGALRLMGNLHWPDDRLGSTPENDVAGNMWFARDIADMAAVLETEPVLMVLREMSPPESGVTPLPVDTSGIPNDHLGYAITWFSLAAIWATMTFYYILRGRNLSKGASS